MVKPFICVKPTNLRQVGNFGEASLLPGDNTAIGYQGYVGDGHVNKRCLAFNGTQWGRTNVNLNRAPVLPTTICLWVYKNTHTTPGTNGQTWMAEGSNLLYCLDSTSGITFSYPGGSLTSTTIPDLNTWYHVAVVVTSTKCELYINNILEDSSPSSITLGNYYELGGGGDSVSRCIGRIDDFKVYEKELNAEERSTAMWPDTDVRFSIIEGGHVSASAYNESMVEEGEEKLIEWTLLDNFRSDVDDPDYRPFDNALGGLSINRGADLTAAGWAYNLTTFESPSYMRKEGYLQMYYSSTPSGYIQKTLPAGYDYVTAIWGNWHSSGTANMKVDGVTIGTDHNAHAEMMNATKYTGTPILRFEEINGIFWVCQVWVGKEIPRINQVKDDKYQGIAIHLANRSPNLHPFSSWSIGSGSVGDFIQNGNTTENVRKWDADPWGNPAITWNAIPDATSGADGGWNHTAVPIDRTCLYRYSVWMTRANQSAGTLYHGCNGYGSTNGVYSRNTGSLTTNPYFFYGITQPKDWRLYVGHIWPTGSGIGENHPNSGMWNNRGQLKNQITTDYYWHPSSITGRGRNYLYYTSTTDQRQRFLYPMFEKCDGTEVPFEWLTTGYAYYGPRKVPDAFIELQGVDHSHKEDGFYINGHPLLH